MGMWDYINSTIESTLGLSSIKNAGVASYGFWASTASAIDNAVRVNGIQKLYGYMPDDDRRAQIGSFAEMFAKNAAVYGLHEGYKHIPGGKVVSKIVSMTVNDMKSENRERDRETAKASPKENNAYKSNKPIADLVGSRKPEDVLRVFMMSEFIGARILDDLVVPGANKSK